MKSGNTHEPFRSYLNHSSQSPWALSWGKLAPKEESVNNDTPEPQKKVVLSLDYADMLYISVALRDAINYLDDEGADLAGNSPEYEGIGFVVVRREITELHNRIVKALNDIQEENAPDVG